MTNTAAVGVIGLGVMGSSLCLNIAENAACRVAGFDISTDKVREASERAKREGNLPLDVYSDISLFVNALSTPRRVILLVPAGKPVDAALADLSELLAPGDVVVDMGNEWFETTEARQARVSARGLHYMGCGISGGETGARSGPCLMPSGAPEAWTLMQPILERIAARTADGPCVTFLGNGAAGNYVKMVHNGIEYGDMQLIGEAYTLLRTVGGMSNAQAAAVFERWSRGPLASYLIEITAQILRTPDDAPPASGDKPPSSRGELIDQILDVCGSKGTGKWTAQEAAERAVPAATMTSALDARYLSAQHSHRQRAAARMPFRPARATRPLLSPALSLGRLMLSAVSALAPPIGALGARLVGWPLVQAGPCLVADLEDALYSSKLCSYAQGLALIDAASQEKGWEIEPAELARIWKGGCIIRADLLDDIRTAVNAREAGGDSILLDSSLGAKLARAQEGWRRTVMRAVEHGVPAPALSASLAYYDSMRQARLPAAAMVQAQRDFFGGHTYKRVDRPGSHHTSWGG